MMTTFTITLSEDRFAKLKELAATSGISPEALLQASIDRWLANPADDFNQAAHYVLRKIQSCIAVISRLPATGMVILFDNSNDGSQ